MEKNPTSKELKRVERRTTSTNVIHEATHRYGDRGLVRISHLEYTVTGKDPRQRLEILRGYVTHDGKHQFTRDITFDIDAGTRDFLHKFLEGVVL